MQWHVRLANHLNKCTSTFHINTQPLPLFKIVVCKISKKVTFWVIKRQHTDAVGSVQRDDVATDSALTLVANLRCHTAAQVTN